MIDFTHLPVEFGHVAYQNDEEKNQVLETLFGITARHLKQIVHVEFLKYASFKLDKLFFLIIKNNELCIFY